MMARLRIVRHGRAAQSENDRDPGLDLTGTREAFAAAERLRHDPPTSLKVSPSRRARETALPFASVFDLEPVVASVYDELPWSDAATIVQRKQQVEMLLRQRWSSAHAVAKRWRDALIANALSERGNVLVVSHLIAINVLVGFATGDDRTLVFVPANASVTEFAVERAGLRLVSLGEESEELRLALGAEPLSSNSRTWQAKS